MGASTELSNDVHQLSLAIGIDTKSLGEIEHPSFGPVGRHFRITGEILDHIRVGNRS
jgi:hypothetical protein